MSEGKALAEIALTSLSQVARGASLATAMSLGIRHVWGQSIFGGGLSQGHYDQTEQWRLTHPGTDDPDRDINEEIEAELNAAQRERDGDEENKNVPPPEQEYNEPEGLGLTEGMRGFDGDEGHAVLPSPLADFNRRSDNDTEIQDHIVENHQNPVRLDDNGQPYRDANIVVHEPREGSNEHQPVPDWYTGANGYARRRPNADDPIIRPLTRTLLPNGQFALLFTDLNEINYFRDHPTTRSAQGNDILLTLDEARNYREQIIRNNPGAFEDYLRTRPMPEDDRVPVPNDDDDPSSNASYDFHRLVPTTVGDFKKLFGLAQSTYDLFKKKNYDSDRVNADYVRGELLYIKQDIESRHPGKRVFIFYDEKQHTYHAILWDADE